MKIIYTYEETSHEVADDNLKFATKDKLCSDDITVEAEAALQAKTVTENGIVTPDEGYDGLNSVTVDVKQGTSDYNELTNKPQINGVELKGDKSSEDLGIHEPTKVSELENDSSFVSSTYVASNYVAKETGKGLSTNDYTDADKTKLAGIAEGAEVNVQSDWNVTEETSDAYIKNKPTIPTKTSELTNDSNFVADANYVHTDNNYTTTEKTKLGTIAEGAEVNVQSDWNVTEETSDAYIKNKPTIPTKTSDLTNDSDFQNGTQVDSKIDTKITAHNTSTEAHSDIRTSISEKASQSDLEALAGRVTTAEGSISTIEGKIPTQATTENQLADKLFVNSSIATNTGSFKGTFDSVEELPTTGVLNNDYAFVKTTESTGQTVFNRYKYNSTSKAWIYEYSLNNSSFTVVQWATINSGMTSTDKVKLDGIAEGAEVNVQSDWNVTETTSDAYILNKPTKLSSFTDDLGSSPVHTHSRYVEKNTTYMNASTGQEVNVADKALLFYGDAAFTLGIKDGFDTTGATKTWCGDGSIEYSLDGITYTTWAASKETVVDVTATKSAFGDYRIYVRGVGGTYTEYEDSGSGDYHYSVFTSTANFSVTGKLDWLLDYTKEYVEAGDCGYLFEGNTYLVDVSGLTLCKYLDSSNGSLAGIFFGCTSLTTAPALPATTLTNYCYCEMFCDCASLKTAPTLPVTTLAENCYAAMFSGCTALTTPPTLPATTLAESCYQAMFYNCTSLTAVPALPATTLATNCYYLMFQGCTALTSPATFPDFTSTQPTLPESCFQEMYSGCTGLKWTTTATSNSFIINATTLEKTSVANMFKDNSGTLPGSEIAPTATPGTPQLNYTYYLVDANKYTAGYGISISTDNVISVSLSRAEEGSF